MAENNEKRPDLDELMAQGMPLWRALEVWNANRASPEAPGDGLDSGSSGPADKPRTRLH